MQGARRRPWRAPRSSRATPQTPLSQPTRRERADFPSFVVVASSLGLDPTTSAPPRLRGNLPRSRPRRILRQAPQPALEKESSPPNGPLLTPKPGTVRETASVEGSHHSWAVQIGSFASRANAEKQMRRLKAHDSSVYVSSSGKGPSSRYRVRIGPFADRAAAEKVMMRLRKEGQSASLVAP
jgi:cell division septation protein DedD